MPRYQAEPNFSVPLKLELAVRTQEEVAEIMTARGYPMGKSAVFSIEQRAVRKLRKGLRQFAADFFAE